MSTTTQQRSETAREPNTSIERYVAGNYLRVAIWVNQLDGGGLGFSVKPTVRYKDTDGNYQTARNFRESDLVHLGKMLFDADTWCQDYRNRQRQQSNTADQNH